MILQELSEAIGVSGNEDAVRAIILKAIDGHATDITIDPMGNVIAIKKGTGKNRPRVMLDAHMEEVGLMVTSIGSDGLIKFTGVGGIDERILPALRVKIGKDAIPGVVIWTPIHKSGGNNTPVRQTLMKVPGVRHVVVEQTWEPHWNSNRLTADGRRKLGLSGAGLQAGA